IGFDPRGGGVGGGLGGEHPLLLDHVGEESSDGKVGLVQVGIHDAWPFLVWAEAGRTRTGGVATRPPRRRGPSSGDRGERRGRRDPPAHGEARSVSTQARRAWDSSTASATTWAFRPSRKPGTAARCSTIAETNSQTTS